MLIRCKTDKGRKRELNEDYVLTLKSSNYTLLIVADGMGGHNAGEIASRIAAMTVRSFIFDNFTGYDNKEELIRDAIVKANAEVYMEASKDNRLTGMGTTLTCGIICTDTIYIGHVGDSRAYIVKNEGAVRLTQDHSLVQELIDNGSITENEALSHPQRNLITRAVGTEKHIIVDTKTEPVYSDDIFVFCTDGLTSYLTSDEIFQMVTAGKEESVELMIDLANERGGSDNISVIVARKGEEK